MKTTTLPLLKSSLQISNLVIQNFYNMEQQVQLQAEIKSLEAQLTGELFADMDIRDKIHNLQMQLDGVRPMDSYIECVGCGS